MFTRFYHFYIRRHPDKSFGNILSKFLKILKNKQTQVSKFGMLHSQTANNDFHSGVLTSSDIPSQFTKNGKVYHYILLESDSIMNMHINSFKNKEAESELISKMPLRVDRQFLLGAVGVYTYIIGTDGNDVTHIYGLQVFAKAEYCTKHSYIVDRIMKLNSTDKNLLCYEGVPCPIPMDKFHYAGELSISVDSTGQRTIKFNFLSGTYMQEVVKSNPAIETEWGEEVKQFITNLLLEEKNLQVERTNENLLININTPLHIMKKYIEAGYKIYYSVKQNDIVTAKKNAWAYLLQCTRINNYKTSKSYDQLRKDYQNEHPIDINEFEGKTKEEQIEFENNYWAVFYKNLDRISKKGWIDENTFVNSENHTIRTIDFFNEETNEPQRKKQKTQEEAI